MLFLSPILFLLSVYMSIVFAYTYVLLTNITEVFQSTYGFSTGSASLVFIGLGTAPGPVPKKYLLTDLIQGPGS